VWHREVPIEAVVSTPDGARRVGGIIDLLLETPAGCVIVDHKTFPATNEAALCARAAEYLPQFVAYAKAVEATGRKVTSMHVHFPMASAAVALEQLAGSAVRGQQL
jgi:hypothetical protein